VWYGCVEHALSGPTLWGHFYWLPLLKDKKKLAKIYYLTVTEEATRKLTVSARDELRIQLQRIL